MDGALKRFTAVVQYHYGRVRQYPGDGMLAAFGFEEASTTSRAPFVLAWRRPKHRGRALNGRGHRSNNTSHVVHAMTDHIIAEGTRRPRAAMASPIVPLSSILDSLPPTM
jgi:class 3 adenylate cyclase